MECLRDKSVFKCTFFIASPFLLALLYYNFGKELTDYFIVGFSYTPVVVLGTLLGVRLGNLLDHKKLKKIVMLLLVATSLVSIISPYFK